MHEWHFLSLAPGGCVLWGVFGGAAFAVFFGPRPRLLPIWQLNVGVFARVIALLVQGPA